MAKCQSLVHRPTLVSVTPFVSLSTTRADSFSNPSSALPGVEEECREQEKMERFFAPLYSVDVASESNADKAADWECAVLSEVERTRVCDTLSVTRGFAIQSCNPLSEDDVSTILASLRQYHVNLHQPSANAANKR